MDTPQPEPAVAEILGFLTRGYPQTAAERAANLLAEQPEHAEAQRLYGVALFRLRQPDAAIAALTRAVELAPDSPTAAWGLAEALQSAGRPAESEAVLLRLLERRPDDAVALVFLARLRLEAGETEAAYDLARRALAADPEVEGGRRLLALLAYRRGALAEAAELLLALRGAGEADPGCLLARSLYALGRNGELAKLPPAAAPAQRHNEAVLLALAAWRANRPEVAARALDLAGEEAGALAGETSVRPYVTLADLLRQVLRHRAAQPALYEGEVSALIAVIGDAHGITTGHLVVPWRAGRALLLPEPLLEAAPSDLLAETPGPLLAAFQAAFERLPKGAQPAVCLGELDLRLTQGLFSRLHGRSETELLRQVQELASKLAELVAAEGRARGVTPILLTPPASNAPLSLIKEAQRGRFLAAHKRFAETLRQAAARLGLPLVDLRAVTLSGERVQARHYIDTNHLWPEAVVEAFTRQAVLPEQGSS